MKDADYLSILHQLILPIAYEVSVLFSYVGMSVELYPLYLLGISPKLFLVSFTFVRGICKYIKCD